MGIVYHTSNIKTIKMDYTSIYQSFINVSDNKNRKIQKLLNEFQKDNANLDVKSKQTYAREFQMQIFSQTALGYMMSIIVGLIGIMNYINTAASSIISRRHEFVILHSIGMTKRQLKNMLLLENIYIVSLVSIFSIMLSSVLGRTFVKSIIETSWCSSYRFAVWPLFAVLLLYFGISIIMPLLLIKNQEGESIVFRMKQLTDSY
ncbi:MAG: ABC transporter permease [Ruminococcus sp.]